MAPVCSGKIRSWFQAPWNWQWLQDTQVEAAEEGILTILWFHREVPTSSENGYSQAIQWYKQTIKMEMPVSDLKPFNDLVSRVNSPYSNSMITKQPADNNLLSHRSLSTGKECSGHACWSESADALYIIHFKLIHCYFCCISSVSWANISLPQKDRSGLGMLLKYGPKSAEQKTHPATVNSPRSLQGDSLLTCSRGSRMWWLEACPLESNSLILDSCFFH